MIGHGKVGLGGNDQRKLLQSGGHFHIRLGAARHYLTQVHRPALGRDCPQNIGQVLHTKAVGRHESLKFGVDEGLSLAGDVGLALALGQEAGAGEPYFCAPAAVPVIDRRNIAAYHLNAVERDIIAGLCGLDRLLLLWLCNGARLLPQNGTRGSAKQSNKQKSSSDHHVALQFQTFRRVVARKRQHGPTAGPRSRMRAINQMPRWQLALNEIPTCFPGWD